MKSIKFFCSLLALYSAIYAQQTDTKTWEQTTAADFNSGSLTDVVVTDLDGGEVELRPQLILSRNEYTDNDALRFITRHPHGDYFIKSLVQNGAVLVQKFASTGEKSGSPLRVSESLHGKAYDPRTAILDDGTALAVWSEGDDESGRFAYGQLFQDSLLIGYNFRISQGEYVTDPHPIPLANYFENNFCIFYSERHLNPDRIIMFMQKRDKQASQLMVTQIHDHNVKTYERIKSVILDREDHVLAVWEGFNGLSSDLLDIYLQKLDLNGKPLESPIIVNDDQNFEQSSPFICLDNRDNFLIVWRDTRSSIPDQNYTFDIYGQYFSSSGKRFGRNFRINRDRNVVLLSPYVRYVDNEFFITWKSANTNQTMSEIKASHWKFDPVFQGEFSSSVLNTGSGNVSYMTLQWQADLPGGTRVRFQLRSAQKESQITAGEWYGPDGPGGYYAEAAGTAVDAGHENHSFIQYRAVLETDSVTESPSLKSVTLVYQTADNMAPSPPQRFQAAAGRSQVDLTWKPSTDKDVLQYHLYRSMESGVSNHSRTFIIPGDQTSCTDTSAVTGTRYYYSIAAEDSSHNIGSAAPEVSVVPLGATFYVENGREGGDGSTGSPFSSINEALEQCIYGDTIRVLPGEYHEFVPLKPGIALIGTGAQSTVLKGLSNEHFVVRCANNTLVKSLTIVRPESEIMNEAVFGQDISTTISENIIVNYGEQEWRGSGVHLTNCSQSEVQNNVIIGFSNGINEIYAGGTMRSGDNILRNNIIQCDTGIRIRYKSGSRIINNTIMPSSTAIYILQSSKIEILNNIIYGKNGNGIFVKSSSVRLDYNNIYQFPEDYAGDAAPGVQNISADPLFVNAARDDYRLRTGSPCINKGHPDEIYNDSGGSRNDMGAYGGPFPMPLSLTSRLFKSISLSYLTASPGDTIIVKAIVDDPIGLKKAVFSVEFDPSLLAFSSARSTSTTRNFSIFLQSGTGEIGLTMASTQEIENGDGEILKFFFIVNQDVHSGDATSLGLKNVQLYDGADNPIGLKSITDGAIVVTRFFPSGRYIFVDCKNVGFEDGTVAHAFRTIHAALEKAAAGDTIIVAAGEYLGSFSMKEDVYLRGSGAMVSRLLPAKENRGAVVRFDSIARGELSGFSILNINRNLESGWAIECRASSPLITNNYLKNDVIIGGLIECSENSKPVISHNTLINSGINIFNSDVIIVDNSISSGSETGILLRDSGGEILQNKIATIAGGPPLFIVNSHGKISGNWLMGDWGTLACIAIEDAFDIDITNNILESLNAQMYGLIMHNSSNIHLINNTLSTASKGINEENSTGLILNNIVVGNKEYGLSVHSGIEHDYNCFWQNDRDYYECTPSDNEFNKDPLFVNPEQSLFLLTDGSPCIDAGHTGSQYNDPDGTRNDLGAYGGPGAELMKGLNTGIDLVLTSGNPVQFDTALVHLQGVGLAKVAKLDMELTYTGSLSLVDVRTTDMTKSCILQKNQKASNSVKLSLVNPDGIQEGDGQILTMLFTGSESSGNHGELIIESATAVDNTINEIAIRSLGSTTIHIVTGVAKENGKNPYKFELEQNYPNPFNATTSIEYRIAKQGRVSVKIYDILGRQVCILLDKSQEPGTYTLFWDGRDNRNYVLPSGLYLLRLKSAQREKIIKLVMIR
ncbi:right-handed parallel beta-helix repeat-containing protein [candidate division KSB1 bacterium]|nr:right-handed parallel beta-helix repeat-containing protein [candidate division KSB1 bacterium]